MFLINEACKEYQEPNILDIYLTGCCKTRLHYICWRFIENRAGQYTAEKPKRRYFCHTCIDIEQKILYRQTDIP